MFVRRRTCFGLTYLLRVVVCLRVLTSSKKQVLTGWAEHTMRGQVADGAGATRAVFDTSSGLTVEKVEVDGAYVCACAHVHVLSHIIPSTRALTS